MIKDILITGSDGFLGKNLCLAIEREYDDVNVIRYNRNNKSADLEIGIKKADIIFIAVSVNRKFNNLLIIRCVADHQVGPQHFAGQITIEVHYFLVYLSLSIF